MTNKRIAQPNKVNQDSQSTPCGIDQTAHYVTSAEIVPCHLTEDGEKRHIYELGRRLFGDPAKAAQEIDGELAQLFGKSKKALPLPDSAPLKSSPGTVEVDTAIEESGKAGGTGKQQENPVMRADEVQQMLRIGKNTLYDWCQRHIIPHKRVGRLILFSRKRIKEWLEKNENEGGKQ